MQFSYKAADSKGKIHTGQLTSDSREETLRFLKTEGFFPLEIKPVQKRSLDSGLRHRISKKDILVFTRQLAGLLESGMQLDKSMRVVTQLLENSSIGPTVTDIQRLMREGASFSQALDTHNQVFGSLYINLVRGGENGGLLPQVMKRLADTLENEIKLKGDILSSILYPALITAVSVITTIILLQVVAPRFEDLFLRMGQELPLITRLVLGFRNKMTRYGLFFLVVTFIAGVLIYRYLRTEKGRLAWHRFSLRLPLLGTIILKLNIADFSRMLGLMLKSGISLLDGLALLKNTMHNKLLAQIIAQAEVEVRKGGALSRFFSTQNELPLLLVQMAGVGEEGGNLDEMVENVARIYDREARQSIENLIALLGPFLILTLTGMIFLIALAVLLPIMSINIQP